MNNLFFGMFNINKLEVYKWCEIWKVMIDIVGLLGFVLFVLRKKVIVFKLIKFWIFEILEINIWS